jgi:hypothetical protein
MQQPQQLIADYLASDHWRNKRRIKLTRVRFMCERCGHGQSQWNAIYVVHRSHDNLLRESMDDLEALCEECYYP